MNKSLIVSCNASVHWSLILSKQPASFNTTFLISAESIKTSWSYRNVA